MFGMWCATGRRGAETSAFRRDRLRGFSGAANDRAREPGRQRNVTPLLLRRLPALIGARPFAAAADGLDRSIVISHGFPPFPTARTWRSVTLDVKGERMRPGGLSAHGSIFAPDLVLRLPFGAQPAGLQTQRA
jgi:hypothetical protein